MIAKAGTGSDFGGVIRYVLSEDKGPEVLHQQELLFRPDERVLFLDEMRLCAEQNLRCTKPVYHLSLSWAPEDRPTPTQVTATSRRFLRDLGLQEHQAFVVRHRDTAHDHVHIVANRVHPDTGKTWKPPHWQRGLHVLCRRVEREMGWQIVPSDRAPDQARPTAREQTAWRKRGVEPLAKKIHRACGARLASSSSWHELERILKMYGYAVAPSGRRGGLVFTDGKRQTSASRVHRELSRPKLERRFGRSLEGHRAALQRIREHMDWSWHRERDDDLGL